MKTITVSAYLPDMLRKYLDTVTAREEPPSEAELKQYSEDPTSLDKKLHDKITDHLWNLFVSGLLKQQESLVQPEAFRDWLHHAKSPTHLEEFYAYQFVDALPKIVNQPLAIAHFSDACR